MTDTVIDNVSDTAFWVAHYRGISVEEGGALARDLKALPSARYWIVDYFSPELTSQRQRHIGRKMLNAPLKFQPENWFGFFESCGWRCKDIRYLSDEGERLGRRPELPLSAILAWTLRAMFASKARRAQFRKYMGYALLESAPARTQKMLPAGRAKE